MLAALLFAIGVYGVLVRRNAVLVLMAVELMLNAVNLLWSRSTSGCATRCTADRSLALFVIVIAAAEIGLGLAIVLQVFRLRATVAVDDARPPRASPTPADPGRVNGTEGSAEVDSTEIADGGGEP